MNIYEKHEKAFSLVSAGALVKDGKQIGTLAIKFPSKGGGRLSCYLHLHGYRMVVGTASGYGYDKSAAAFEDACSKLCHDTLLEFPEFKGVQCGGYNYYDTLRKIGIAYYKGV